MTTETPDLRAICNTASGLRQPVGGGIILTDPSGWRPAAGFNLDAFSIMICRRMKRTTNARLRQWENRNLQAIQFSLEKHAENSTADKLKRYLFFRPRLAACQCKKVSHS